MKKLKPRFRKHPKKKSTYEITHNDLYPDWNGHAKKVSQRRSFCVEVGNYEDWE